jgi:hypothetical protein
MRQMAVLSHNTGSSTATQRRQANNPNTATHRWVFQDMTLTKKTATIKTVQIKGIPSRPNLP